MKLRTRALALLALFGTQLVPFTMPMARANGLTYPSANSARVVMSSLKGLAPIIAAAGVVRTVTAGSGGGVDVKDVGIQVAIGSVAAGVTALRSISAANVAKVAVRGVAGGLVVGVAAAAVQAAYCEYTTGSWRCDPLQNATASTETQYCASSGGYVCESWSAPAASYTAAWAAHKSYLEGETWSVSPGYSLSWSQCTEAGQTGCGGAVSSAAVSVVLRTTSGPGGPYYSTYTVGIRSFSATVTQCPAYTDGAGVAHAAGAAVADADGKCPTGVMAPATEAAVADRVEGHIPPGTGAPSVVVETLGQAIEIGDLAGDTELSGPASVTQPMNYTTETPPGGLPLTTTQQTVNNIDYEGDTMSWNSVTTTTAPDGTTTTTEEGNEATPPVTDTALGDVPTLYERKYPAGIGGVWSDKQAAFYATPVFGFIGGLVPSFSDGGCPSWSWSSGRVLGIDVGGDLQVPCYVWAFVRLCMIITATLTARRLIFGG